MVRILFVSIVSSFIFLSGCAGGKKKLSAIVKVDTVAKAMVQRDSLKNALAVYNNVNKQLALYDNHITFYGIIPEWDLLIQQDSMLIFQSAKDTLRFLITKKTYAQGGSFVRYVSKEKKGLYDTLSSINQILLTIVEKPFLDQASATYYPFSIEITTQEQSGKQLAYFSGGGFYTGNPRIHDIWALDSLNGNKVSPSEYPDGVPVFEFHLDGGKLYGFAGCNNFSGSYYFVENQIQFIPPASTLKMCEQMSTETSFLELLNKKIYTYSFLANRLILSNSGGSTIVLKKVD